MEHIELKNLEELSYEKREAFNTLRTNINFSGNKNKVILFTSCTPDEGKSSMVMGLARAYAEDNKRVLVLDCDLRKLVLASRHYKKKEQDEIKGMSHYLAGHALIRDVLKHTDVENLDIIFGGKAVPNPTELLGNRSFKHLIDQARNVYDVVLIDSPPLGSVIDAAVIAPFCDGAVLVVESNKNSYRLIQDVKKQLEVTGIKILGVVLNKVQVEDSKYYSRHNKGTYYNY